MGLIRAVRKISGLFLLSVFFSQCMAEDAITLENIPWPAERKCDECVTIQFSTMEMRLPLNMIGKILALGELGSLHILAPSGNPKESVLFGTIPPERLLKAYEQNGLLQGLNVSTNEQLFDAIGKLPGNNKSLALLRKIEGIDAASRYTKASKGPVHVYWIQSPLPGGSQRIHFVMDNDEVVCDLFGDVTQEFYAAVLSNLRIVAIP